MSLYNDDDTAHQSTEDACVEHNPQCAAFLGSEGLCNACWAVEHESHTSTHCEESCPYCKPLLAKLSAAEDMLSRFSFMLSDVERYPTDLSRKVCRVVSYCYPEHYSMVARLHSDGTAYDIALSAIKNSQGKSVHNGF